MHLSCRDLQSDMSSDTGARPRGRDGRVREVVEAGEARGRGGVGLMSGGKCR